MVRIHRSSQPFRKRPVKSLFFGGIFFLFLPHFFLSKRASSKWIPMANPDAGESEARQKNFVEDFAWMRRFETGKSCKCGTIMHIFGDKDTFHAFSFIVSPFSPDTMRRRKVRHRYQNGGRTNRHRTYQDTPGLFSAAQTPVRHQEACVPPVRRNVRIASTPL